MKMDKIIFNEGNIAEIHDSLIFNNTNDFKLVSKDTVMEFVTMALILSGREGAEVFEDMELSVKNYEKVVSENKFNSEIEGLNKILKEIGMLFVGGYFKCAALLISDKEYTLEKVFRFGDIYNSEYYEVIELEGVEGLVVENENNRFCWNYNENTVFKAHNVWCDIDNANYTDYFEEYEDFREYYEVCEYCGDIFEADSVYNNNIVYIEELGLICEDCAEDRGWVRCRDTGEWVNGPWCGDSCCDCCGCENCPYYVDYEDEDEYESDNKTGDFAVESILNKRLGYVPTAPIGLYKGNDYVDIYTDTADYIRKNGVYFGIEIETKIYACNSEDSMDFVVDSIRNGLVDAKYDMSICSDRDNEGFEFVTKRLFNIYDNKSLFILKDFVENVKKAGFIADSDCGIHIHIDKMGLWTSEDFIKMAYYIENSRLRDIENVFGREFSLYCGKIGNAVWANAEAKMQNNNENINFDNILRSLNQYGSHHVFLNITNNTVEFRLFAGSVNFNRVVRDLVVLTVIHDTVQGKSFYELEEGWNDRDYDTLRLRMLKLQEEGLINEKY